MISISRDLYQGILLSTVDVFVYFHSALSPSYMTRTKDNERLSDFVK